MKPSMRLALLAALAAAGWAAWSARPARAPALEWRDTRGGTGSLAAPRRPAVVVLWITDCAYCTRSLLVADEIRRLYAEDDLDVVGFYLNRADDEEVERLARAEGHRVAVARGQPDPAYVNALLSGFRFRGTGRDVYVVGTDGRFDAVDASDLSQANGPILQKIRSLLLYKHHLKERV